MSELIGHVAELWRYPVKSLRGEALDEARCTARGIEGDRLFAVVGRDGKLGSGKTTGRFRRMPGLLSMSSALDEDGAAWLSFPDGTRARAEGTEAAHLVGTIVGEQVSIEREGAISHFDDAPLHLLSTASLRWLQVRRGDDQIDRRRFRPNVVIECEDELPPEAGWQGRELRIGGVTASVWKGTERCVMVTLPQAELGFAPGLLKYLEGAAGACLGTYARVTGEGLFRVGDEVVAS